MGCAAGSGTNLLGDRTFAYDRYGRVTSVTDGEGTSQAYGFHGVSGDQANIQSWSTGADTMTPGSAKGASQTFSYDSLNRVTKVLSLRPLLEVALWVACTNIWELNQSVRWVRGAFVV